MTRIGTKQLHIICYMDLALKMADTLRAQQKVNVPSVIQNSFTQRLSLMKMDTPFIVAAHINVEWYNRSKAIKYLNKGPNRVTVVIQENVQKGDNVTPKRGPKTFEELMTVNKRLCQTFKEACFAYGLLNDYREWARAISEASLWALGPQSGDLSTRIIFIICDIKQATHNHGKKSWYCLSGGYSLHRKTENYLDFQDLPWSNPQLLTNMDNRLIREALDFDMNKSKLEHETLHPLLNPEQ
ncbi:hypothetical protein Tco_1076050 [Tanacetum coccineum]